MIFWAALLLLAFFLVKARSKPAIVDRIESQFIRFSQRKTACVAMVVILVPLLRLSVLPWVPIPEAAIHDEFSYILMGNTFAMGRLTNPPHPMAVHFETMHVNQWPTYQSMYPPAQGIFLAIGKAAFGNPWYGVLLSVALMCGAILWMLQGWLPPGWALLGGLFCVLRFAIFSYWTNTYFGGAVAAMAGALFFGSLVRMRQRPNAAISAVVAFSLVLVANSRPYEGFMTVVAGCVAAIVWLWRSPLAGREKFNQVVLPAGLVLAAGVCAMGYYNWRGTGHPLEMPYQVNFEKYRITNVFLWQKLRPIPEYAHFQMKKFYIFSEFRDYLTAHNEGIADYIQKKVEFYYRFFVFPCLIFFVLGFRETVKDGRYRLLAISLAIALAGVLVVAYLAQAHYAATATCLVVLLMLVGLRKLRLWRPWGTSYGLELARVAVFAVFAVLCYEIAADLISYKIGDVMVFDKQDILIHRPRILAQLQSMPGKHLVIVRYEHTHNFNDEWIYNEPDVDASKVVFARDMGEGRNQELLNYFGDRQIWLVEADEVIPRIYPYDQAKDRRIGPYRPFYDMHRHYITPQIQR